MLRYSATAGSLLRACHGYQLRWFAQDARSPCKRPDDLDGFLSEALRSMFHGRALSERDAVGTAFLAVRQSDHRDGLKVALAMLKSHKDLGHFFNIEAVAGISAARD